MGARRFFPKQPQPNKQTNNNNMNEETQIQTTNQTGLSIFDSGTFEQMGMIASKLAQSTLVPATLKGASFDETAANCFRVVEQAQRWNLSPFAVIDCASVIHGKLMWEGKLIAGALYSLTGIRLRYEYSGAGQQRKIKVSGDLEGRTESLEGTVQDWKTTKTGSPWDRESNHDQMLSYRGARQWARRYTPEVILGIYSPDEINEDDLRDVTPAKKQPKIEPFKKKQEVIEEPAQEETPQEPIISDDPPKTEDLDRIATIKKVDSTHGDTCTRYAISMDIGGKSIETFTFSHRIAKDAQDNTDKASNVCIRYNKDKGTSELLSVSKLETSTGEKLPL